MALKTLKKNGAVLAVVSIAAISLVLVTQRYTAPKIHEQQQLALQKSLTEVLPAGGYGDIMGLEIQTLDADPLLGTSLPSTTYRVRQGKKTRSLILKPIALAGYGGSIPLLVGVDREGKVTGVRVIPPHAETPGLGDNVDIRKSAWVLGFNDKSLLNPDESRWGLKKEGGQFDAITGATITSRAVITAVKNSLRYVQQHQATLFGETHPGADQTRIPNHFPNQRGSKP